MVVLPSCVTPLEIAVSDASRSAGSVPPPPNGPSRELTGPPEVPASTAIQDFPRGSGPLTPPGILMYAFGGMKISVIPTGYCPLTIPPPRPTPNPPPPPNQPH